MSATAVICELNPLHNGHLHIINKAKAASPDPVVLVMSGNFTQRAGAAAFHKYARARAAVEAGADLCVELPFPYSSAGAEYFARAGVYIAEKLGAVRLIFGSESGDISYLQSIADTLSAEEYRSLFRRLSEKDPASGAAVIRERALRSLIPDYQRGAAPNDTLAVEYIRNAACECIPIKRIDTPSASTLRTLDPADCTPFIPPAALEMINTVPRSDGELLCDILWKHLRLTDPDLSATAECAGGLGGRLKKIARESATAEEFFTACRTKRYTNSRLIRAALFAFLGVCDGDITAPPAFTAVLAANSRGTALLAEMRKSPAIPVITKPADHASLPEDARRGWELSRKADELYSLLIGEKAGYFMKMTPYVKKLTE